MAANTHQKAQRGFTIVELMFAMIFIAFILLFTTISVIQIVQQYNRGIELKAISQSGRSITEMIARDIATSGAVAQHGAISSGVGMLCMGNDVVYAWNGIDSPANVTQRNAYAADLGARLAFVRTIAPGACADATAPQPGQSNSLIIPDSGTFETTELLSPQIQVLDVELVAITTNLYRLHVTLGTARDDAYMDEGGVNVCKPGNDTCAKAEFSTTVYTP